jgi:hypothetical protein
MKKRNSCEYHPRAQKFDKRIFSEDFNFFSLCRVKRSGGILNRKSPPPPKKVKVERVGQNSAKINSVIFPLFLPG